MNKIKVMSIEATRSLDRQTIDEGWVAGEELMRRAGEKIANKVIQIAEEKKFSRQILLIAGKGNNGGDAFVTAAYLHENHYLPEVILTAPIEELKGDALIHFRKMMSLSIPVHKTFTPETFLEKLSQFKGHVLLDGLLGTGFKPPLNSFFRFLIEEINKRSLFIISIDIPSGLANDNATAIHADVTLSIGTLKDFMLQSEILSKTGRVHAIDINYPEKVLEKFSSPAWIFKPESLNGMIKRRLRNAYKGSFGHSLLIGGDNGKTGAIVLSGLGAIRSGSGLTTVATTNFSIPIVHSSIPEIMTLSFDSSFVLEKELSKFSAIGIGPGLSTSKTAEDLLFRILSTGNQPLILDADSLNILSKSPNQWNNTSHPLIITPHPGEAGRILQTTTKEIQRNRLQAVLQLQSKTKATVILKGAQTLVSNGIQTFVHLTGTPAMSSAGMGDVLTGMITAFVSQGYSLIDSCNIAVSLQGLTAEQMELQKGPFGWTASELAHQIPLTINSLGLLLKI